MTNEQFKTLLLKFKQQQLTGEELDLFLKEASLPEREALLGEMLTDDLAAYTPGASTDPEAAEKVWNKLSEARNNIEIPEAAPAKLYRLRYWKWAAAAVVIIAAAIWLRFISGADHNSKMAKNEPAAAIEPVQQSVVLTLSDGRTIQLDSVANGKLAEEGATQVMKASGGELSYQVTDNKLAASQETLYNSMSTPPGTQYHFTLPDGTRVWMNAASSISFPTAFTGKQRQVKIKGEVYFEVLQNKEQPFLVNVDDRGLVEVLGTSFNINAYNNEQAIKTTLLEGSLLVGNRLEAGRSKDQVKLKPGEQALQKENHVPVVLKEVDKEKVMAWKTGVFNFNNASLQEVMRELARWYDIEVVYEKGVPELEFVGKISRKLTLQQVLNGLQGTGFKFRIEAGRKLVITH
ncbi:FecR family protein [Pseudoflavitalea rhizosphaerae]|uniref:FecR family protein n=1 Tax=Pseudoflavitalea rhizosphaerae TaxID=1884793 RepID=UPI000F8C38DE|nr:FecR family protein [Pseudoflavitalea rhizosphaerae]